MPNNLQPHTFHLNAENKEEKNMRTQQYERKRKQYTALFHLRLTFCSILLLCMLFLFCMSVFFFLSSFSFVSWIVRIIHSGNVFLNGFTFLYLIIAFKVFGNSNKKNLEASVPTMTSHCVTCCETYWKHLHITNISSFHQ